MSNNPLSNIAECAAPEHSRRYEIRAALWTLFWVGSWLILLKAIEREALQPGPLAYLAIILSIGLGIGTIAAFVQMLRKSDELRRKINLDALALAVGVGIVGGFTQRLLVAASVISGDAFTHIVMAMMVTYSLGVIVGHLRYS